MFKLRITFVTLALLSAVLSRPVPAPTQQLTSSGDIDALALPGLDAVTGLLTSDVLGGDDNNDDTGDGDDEDSGLLGLKRQIDDISDILSGFDPLDLLSRQDDEQDDSDLVSLLDAAQAAGLFDRQDGNGRDEDVEVEDPSMDDNEDGSDADLPDFVGRAKRQDDGGDDAGDDSGDDSGGDDAGDDNSDDSVDDNSRRGEDALLPFSGNRYRGGLRGPPEHTGLAGLGDNVGDALTSLGKGLGQLLKRQDDGGDDSDEGDDSGDDIGDDTGDDNSRREENLGIPFLGGHQGRYRHRGGLRGPPEHTGLAGLGDNLGDALTSLGKGLGQLLKRQDDSGDDSGDNNGDNNGADSGDDSGDNSADNSGTDTGDNSADNSGTDTGDNSADSSGADSGDDSGDNSADSSGADSGDDSSDNNADSSGADSGDDSSDNNADSSGADSGDDNSEDNASQAESTSRKPVLRRPALPIPGLAGLIGPHEHTGLAGLGDNVGDALTSLGAGLGQLL